MEWLITNSLNHLQKEQVRDLWNREYPIGIAHRTSDAFQKQLDKWEDKAYILLIDENSAIKGWMCLFTRDESRWFSLLISEDIQRNGWGKRFLEKAREQETELNGWVVDHANDKKLNGAPYRSPIHFYVKNGFSILSDNRLELENISTVQVQWRK